MWYLDTTCYIQYIIIDYITIGKVGKFAVTAITDFPAPGFRAIFPLVWPLRDDFVLAKQHFN